MHREKYSYTEKETSLNIVQNNIDAIRKKNISRTGLRIYKDGLIGVGGILGTVDEAELERLANEGLKAKIPYPYPLSGPVRQHIDLPDTLPGDKEMINRAQLMLDHLKQRLPEFSFSNKINKTTQCHSLVNDAGLDLKYSDTWVTMGLLFKKKTSANIFDGLCAYDGKEFAADEYEDYICRVCEAYDEEAAVDYSTPLPVIFLSSESLPLMQFYKDLNGLAFANKNSLLCEKKGVRVFNERVTLYQNMDYRDHFTPFFDAEGVINKDFRYTLIDRGTVLAPYTDKKTAERYSLELTGSSAAAYDGVPTLAGRPLDLECSGKTLQQLLDGEKGILVFMAGGGDFTPKGDFASPVQFSLLTDGVRFYGRLPQIQISSNYFDMFGKDFIGVSKEGHLGASKEKYLAIRMKVEKL